MSVELEDRTQDERRTGVISFVGDAAVSANRSPAEAVQRAMRGSAYRSLARIAVSNCEGRIVLAGRVSSYYLKQLAQTLAMRAGGRVEVINEVQVC